ncbi:MAG: ArsR/SmtB family transcription factor [Candidatus Eiseniibacteriota bacterium]
MNDDRHRRFKDALYGQLARVSKALANPHRLELIDLLAQGEHTVEELAELAGMPVGNTSQHLQALRTALLVTTRRQGSFVFYRLSGPGVFETWKGIRDLGRQQFAEVEQLVRTYMTERGRLESVSAAELLERMKRKAVVVLDVRPEPEYRAGHILGARSIPIRHLERHLRRLPRRRAIVAYCRGPFCVYSDEAVTRLRRHGFKAARLTVGFPDWQAAGLPVDRVAGGGL